MSSSSFTVGIHLIPGQALGHPASCCAIRGDVNDSGFGPDMSDLLYLLDYLINGGPAPPCMEQADVNGSGGDADSDDVDYLVDHMFLGGPPPVPCE